MLDDPLRPDIDPLLGDTKNLSRLTLFLDMGRLIFKTSWIFCFPTLMICISRTDVGLSLVGEILLSGLPSSVISVISLSWKSSFTPEISWSYSIFFLRYFWFWILSSLNFMSNYRYISFIFTKIILLTFLSISDYISSIKSNFSYICLFTVFCIYLSRSRLSVHSKFSLIFF